MSCGKKCCKSFLVDDLDAYIAERSEKKMGKCCSKKHKFGKVTKSLAWEDDDDLDEIDEEEELEEEDEDELEDDEEMEDEEEFEDEELKNEDDYRFEDVEEKEPEISMPAWDLQAIMRQCVNLIEVGFFKSKKAWMSTSQAAKWYGVNERTIRRWIEDEKLNYVDIGKNQAKYLVEVDITSRYFNFLDW